MSSRSRWRTRRWGVAVLCSFSLVAAACGDDDDEPTGTDAPSTAAPDATEAPDGTEAPEATEAPVDTEAPVGSEAPVDTEAPAADGEPIKIGVQNLEGDPNGSFPEYSAAVQAGADYINAELGGLGGRPIEIVLCKSVVSPDDSQRCANELAADEVELVVSTINFFGNHFSIYQGSEIPVIVGTPITIADFTSPGVYSIGAGGGCLGVHTGLIQFTTQELPKITGTPVTKVGVPWADTPPGVVCYNDLEAKPLDVLNGTEPGDAELAGSMPDLTYIGVPIAPATPDVTPQATEVLDFEPDAIVFSGQGADCWNLVNGLGRLGWTPEQIPMTLSGACTDFTAMRDAGDLAVGIYITGTENSVLAPLDGLEGQHLDNATTYQTKGLEYGLSEDDLFKGFAGQGFSIMMNLWEVANAIDGDITGQSLSDAFAATDGSAPAFGGSPLDCAGAPAPYIAVCSSPISVSQWDGEKLVTVIDSLSGLDLVAGTELRPGG
jgi:branched-chain amino acid transport system substrate-binding protein